MQLDMDGWTLIRCRATEIGSVNEYERIVQTIQKYFDAYAHANLENIVYGRIYAQTDMSEHTHTHTRIPMDTFLHATEC